MKCCFTGHRVIPEDKIRTMYLLLGRMIEAQILNGCNIFAVGGALGFDTIVAETVIKLKEKYPKIQLHLYLPCVGQEKNWSIKNQKHYNEILDESDRISYMYTEYTKGCMFDRNRALVDGSDICIAYCTKDTGGSAYTVNYANKCGVEVINIADFI